MPRKGSELEQGLQQPLFLVGKAMLPQWCFGVNQGWALSAFSPSWQCGQHRSLPLSASPPSFLLNGWIISTLARVNILNMGPTPNVDTEMPLKEVTLACAACVKVTESP